MFFTLWENVVLLRTFHLNVLPHEKPNFGTINFRKWMDVLFVLYDLLCDWPSGFPHSCCGVSGDFQRCHHVCTFFSGKSDRHHLHQPHRGLQRIPHLFLSHADRRLPLRRRCKRCSCLPHANLRWSLDAETRQILHSAVGRVFLRSIRFW